MHAKWPVWVPQAQEANGSQQLVIDSVKCKICIFGLQLYCYIVLSYISIDASQVECWKFIPWCDSQKWKFPALNCWWGVIMNEESKPFLRREPEVKVKWWCKNLHISLCYQLFSLNFLIPPTTPHYTYIPGGWELNWDDEYAALALTSSLLLLYVCWFPCPFASLLLQSREHTLAGCGKYSPIDISKFKLNYLAKMCLYFAIRWNVL